MNVVLTDDKTFQIWWWSHKWRQVKFLHISFPNENKCHLGHSFPKADIQLQAVCALAHLHQIQTVGGWDNLQAVPCVETIHRPLLVLRLFRGQSCAETTHRPLPALRLLTGHFLQGGSHEGFVQPPPGSRRLPARGAPAQVPPCESDSLWNWNY